MEESKAQGAAPKEKDEPKWTAGDVAFALGSRGIIGGIAGFVLAGIAAPAAAAVIGGAALGAAAGVVLGIFTAEPPGAQEAAPIVDGGAGFRSRLASARNRAAAGLEGPEADEIQEASRRSARAQAVSTGIGIARASFGRLGKM